MEEAVSKKFEQRLKGQALARSRPRDRNSKCQEKRFSQTPQFKLLHGFIFWRPLWKNQQENIREINLYGMVALWNQPGWDSGYKTTRLTQ